MSNLRKKIYKISFVLLLTGCQIPVNQVDTPCCTPLPENEIKSQARQQTVMIIGKGKGTGFIIGQDGYKHYVLTSKHVVGFKPAQNITLPPDLGNDEKELATVKHEDPYKVVAYDGKEFQEYIINYEEVRKDSKLDLAIIQFDSQSQGKKYPIARLVALPVSNNENIYIYGFKDCFDKPRNVKEEFNQGKILSDNKNISEDEGYTLQYTNPTIRGMSGSPVYDVAGRIIAIHGKPGRKFKDKEYVFRNCPPLTSGYGNNEGISIETFKNSELAKNLPFKLAFEKKAVDTGALKNTKNDNKFLKDKYNGEIHFKKLDNK
ncbi:S1 family peptidase [Nostoc sp.]|uniref:S1 family peptidase n=1 Tax=Nostoc sp. TaxID=1180 RepID=UPI002FFB0C4D